MSIRLLDFRNIQMSPKHLGMPSSSRQAFESAINHSHGMVLICGPTGSGKTTTLYVALQMINDGQKHLISIEDPVEYRLQGVNQIQVNPDQGLDFATGLRSILRQDPDVIMVGEIRDPETAGIALQASLTGHLVLSTLHTIDSVATVARLVELGVDARRFAEALNLVIAQRLIRLICPDCKKPMDTHLIDPEELGIETARLDQAQIFSAVGCPNCNGTGYFGRTGLFELFIPDSYTRPIIETGEVNPSVLKDKAIRAGMRTLKMEGVNLFLKGLTTKDEVLRVTR